MSFRALAYQIRASVSLTGARRILPFAKWSAVVIAITFGASDKPNAQLRCIDAFSPSSSVSDRYSEVNSLQSNDRYRRFVVTQLLRETMHPLMVRFTAQVERISSSEFEAGEGVRVRQSPLDHAPTSTRAQDLGFTNRFRWKLSGPGPIESWATDFNLPVVQRLHILKMIIQKRIAFELASDPEIVAMFEKQRSLVRAETFVQSDIESHAELGALTIVDAISVLTSQPLSGYETPEALMRAAATRLNGRPSLLEQMALLLGPAVIGPTAGTYPTHPLDVKNGILTWSSSMLESFRRMSSDKNKSHFQRGEHGFGCPVAHCDDSQKTSDLQNLIEAIVGKVVNEDLSP